MPRGNGMGPMGAGPMTGRGAGWCAGYDRPGYANPAQGQGFGFGQHGAGRGWRNMYYATGTPGRMRFGRTTTSEPRAQEIASLKTEASELLDQLAAITKRIKDLKGHGAGGPAE